MVLKMSISWLYFSALSCLVLILLLILVMFMSYNRPQIYVIVLPEDVGSDRGRGNFIPEAATPKHRYVVSHGFPNNEAFISLFSLFRLFYYYFVCNRSMHGDMLSIVPPSGSLYNRKNKRYVDIFRS